jgi:serine/threonine-protein kinase
MNLQPQQTLAHYRLLEKIGEGGMGVVWKALDTSLNREVAIKILPEAFLADGERLGRLQREARLLASLNHPGIASVFGLHEDGGMHFLAMELVPGEDLAQRLMHGPLPMDEAVRVTADIAQALEAAHEQGVIHRDLKPANIKLTADGKVKVLDFGLAKALESSVTSGAADPSMSPTVTSAGTVAGVVLGTPAYMSPEQARGRPADRRADIWALGTVLYELLSGRRAFGGETVSDSLAAILKSEPDWNALPAATPLPVRRLLKRCLTKDPERRLPHVSAIRFELLEPDTTPPGAAGLEPGFAAAPSRLLRLLPWALSLALAGAVLAILWQSSGSATREIYNLAAPFAQDLKLPDTQTGVLALSPDGRSMAVVLSDGQSQRIYLKKMDTGKLEPLQGAESADTPFFSPDSRWLGFFAGGALKKVLVEGGRPITICQVTGNNRGASWGEDGRIVFAEHFSGPLREVLEAGGSPTDLTILDKETGERSHRWPQFISHEDMVLFTVGRADSPEYYDGADIDAQRLSTGERTTILKGASMARYLPTGDLVFARDGFLFAVPFDIKELKTMGTPVPVLEDLRGSRPSGLAYVSFARNGTMAYIQGEPFSQQGRLTWRTRDGKSEPLDAPVDQYYEPSLSPDGTKVALAMVGDSRSDIWIYQIEGNTLTRLTFAGDNVSPVWTPDGKQIAFSSVRDDQLASVYTKAADGSGEAHLLFATNRHPDAGGALPTSWTPDGNRLAVQITDQNQANIIIYSPEDDEEIPFLTQPFTESNASFSPDGKWLAYISDESGTFQVYVRPFPGPGGKWQISVNEGVEPRWTRDGKEILFRTGRQLLTAEIDVENGFKAARPQVLLDDLPIVLVAGTYSIAPDGQRVLVVEPAGPDTAPEQVTVVINWFSQLHGQGGFLP